MQQYKLSEIVAKFGGKIVGNDVVITDISTLNTANSNQITFITDDKYKNELPNCKASAIIISEKHADKINISKIITDNPYLYFSLVSNLFNPAKVLAVGVKSSVVIGSNTIIPESSAISDNVVIGQNTTIGQNIQIYANVVIGDNVTIGDNVKLYPNITIYDNVKIGNNTTIHAGTVVGSDGFGYAPDKNKHWNKIPQIGGVVIGNKVEIGANTTIDSGAMEPTVIEDGVIIDNLVQVAHNVKIGAHSAIAACVGIAGSTKIGKYCTLAGGAGLTGHIDICDHTVIGGATNIGKSITKPDLYFGVYPATTYKDWAKSAVGLKNITTMQQRIRDLEDKITKLIERDVTND
jgi:UDP-3-O-[3-hydroxymyristoyl] glucosamine N-acyltransferase